MSLLKKLKNSVVGGAVGFVTGGYAGAAAGAAAGFSQGNPKKTKNIGYDPTHNVTKGKIQLDPTLSPQTIGPPAAVQAALGMTGAPLSAPVSAGTMSASGLVRNSADAFRGSGFVRQASYQGGMAQPAYFQGGGATGNFPIMSAAPGTSPVTLYHMFYTKKGTPRRIKANGMPYKAPRMNPMNPRAARRAIRRIRGARRLLQRIERTLPKARARAPSHRRAA